MIVMDKAHATTMIVILALKSILLIVLHRTGFVSVYAYVTVANMARIVL